MCASPLHFSHCVVFVYSHICSICKLREPLEGRTASYSSPSNIYSMMESRLKRDLLNVQKEKTIGRLKVKRGVISGLKKQEPLDGEG